MDGAVPLADDAAVSMRRDTQAAGTSSQPPAVDTTADDAGPQVEPNARRWTAYGFDQRNSQTNPNETQLSPATVTRLKERWRLHVPDGATSTPAVLDGTAYFGAWDGRVYAVDAASGDIRAATPSCCRASSSIARSISRRA